MEKPTIEEWKKNNPSKALADYFLENPQAKRENNNSQSGDKTTYQEPVTSGPPSKRSVNIGSILVSIVMIVAFFLPWFDLKILGLFGLVDISGFDLPRVLDLLFEESARSSLKTIYLIPVCAFIAIVGEVQNSWLKIVAQIVAVLTTGYWFLILGQLIFSFGDRMDIQLDPLGICSYGLYLTVAGCIYYIYDTIRELV